MWECTECGGQNDVDPDAEEGQLLDCLECGAEFEIVALDPLELELAHEAPDDLERDDEDVDEDEEEEAWA